MRWTGARAVGNHHTSTACGPLQPEKQSCTLDSSACNKTRCGGGTLAFSPRNTWTASKHSTRCFCRLFETKWRDVKRITAHNFNRIIYHIHDTETLKLHNRNCTFLVVTMSRRSTVTLALSEENRRENIFAKTIENSKRKRNTPVFACRKKSRRPSFVQRARSGRASSVRE